MCFFCCVFFAFFILKSPLPIVEYFHRFVRFTLYDLAPLFGHPINIGSIFFTVLFRMCDFWSKQFVSFIFLITK
uniref:Uncharacterized protein n=1 Tax=Panstrongylus lignarius TaxID=156445 RepID=A0A224Y0I0_9HEMI